MNDCSMTFKKISALRALRGDVKKNVHFQRKKMRSHGMINIHKNVSALRASGGDVEIFRTEFLGGDRDEKIDFQK